MTSPALMNVPRTEQSRTSTARLLENQFGHSLRELWRSRVVFVFTFLFPLTWLVVIGLIAGYDVVDGSAGVRVMQFVTPTAAAMGVLYAAFPTVATSLAVAREQGVLKRVRGTPLPAWVYLTGRLAAAVVFAVASVLTMLAVGVIAYDVRIVGRTVLATVVTVVMGIACFAALGLAVAALAPTASRTQSASIATSVVLSFFSGLMTTADLPSWANRIAAVLPLKPFNDALRHQFDPFRPGAGWDLRALAVTAAWGLVGGIVAARRFRWEPATGRSARGQGRAAGIPTARVPLARGAGAVASPGRPPARALIRDQVLWANRGAWRDAGWIFFAVVMPVALYTFTMTMAVRDRATDMAGGLPVALYAAAGMSTWGAAVTAFINLPEAVVTARDRGVLKRLRGTPVTPAVYLLARTISALWIVLLTVGLVVAEGVVFFDLRISWAQVPVALAVLLLGTLALGACGFLLAAAVPNAKAMTAVGLGVLLPMSFFSDVFIVNGAPAWMATVGSYGPMKHLADSLAAALSPGEPSVSWTALGVLTAWLVGAAVLAVRTFRWSAREG